ncbi:MAG: outer membrane protein assembly factor BamE [Rickettsiales bacterium]|nr:outer membrane protein assembly factor BamE [Rickettsiales bacterium]
MKKHSIVLILLSLIACSPKIDNRGYTNDEDWKSKIVVGESNKEAVLGELGSPSAQSSFGPDVWYYISSRKETVAFFKPETVEQNVTAIEFDATGLVTSVKNYTGNDAKEFDTVKRTTPTEGHSLGFFEQVLGNIGRFNKPGTTGSPRRPTGPNGY